MRRLLAGIGLAAGLGVGPALAFDEAEHRRLVERAIAVVVDECPAPIDARRLAERSARSARDDRSPGRYHVRGRTPYEQLDALTVALLESARDPSVEIVRDDGTAIEIADNAVANYLVYHSRALHFASRRDLPFERALEAEAVALGFLVDAFSSAHLLTPVHLAVSGLQRANLRAAHHFFAGEGAYVLNGHGDAWQTFGDGRLEWYAPTYERVFAGCRESLREVFLVRLVRAEELEARESFSSWAARWGDAGARSEIVDRWLGLEDGKFFYREARLPGLLSIPMPVAASWSLRVEGADSSGFARRHHYPQLRDPGEHDPIPELDERYLFPRSSVPEWMVAPGLEPSGAIERVREDPGFASVHYFQKRNHPPSVAGTIVRAGGGAIFGSEGGGVVSAALGYVWEFPTLVTATHVAFELEYYGRLGVAGRKALAPYVLLGSGAPTALFERVHLKLGYAVGLEAPLDEDGYAWGVGVATPALQFPFTYAGVSLRVGYQQFRLERALDGVHAELVLQ